MVRLAADCGTKVNKTHSIVREMLSIAAGVYSYKMCRKINKKVRTSKVIVLPLNEKQILSSGYDYSRLSTGDY